jgi:type I phosphodiesterase/nucleotide pyrophosphatase
MRRFALVAFMLLLAVLTFTRVDTRQRANDAGENVVLITLDGARTQEIFAGLDADVLRSTLKDGQTLETLPIYKKFWAPSAEERRRKLMPFFWTMVSEHGSIAGNHRVGSAVRLRNRHWFSYPGYAEILLGQPHDSDIASNDAVRNPYVTVLETLRERLNLPRDKVATFAGWGVFNQIVEHTEGATFTNAGVESLGGPYQDVKLVNELQRDAATPWDNTRFDAFTFRLAMAHLAAAKPRVLYLAFDETDDWAHDGRYDRVLETFARTDDYLKQLWDWLQSQPEYRGRTHVLITTDHGRGQGPKDWRDHGAKVSGSGNVWIAFASPRMRRRGEWRDAPSLTTSQIAATLAAWMGVDWNVDHPDAGRPIEH